MNDTIPLQIYRHSTLVVSFTVTELEGNCQHCGFGNIPQCMCGRYDGDTMVSSTVSVFKVYN